MGCGIIVRMRCPTRRPLLRALATAGLASLAPLAGCARFASPAAGPDADLVLLGEWHDAPAHHALRGRWIAAQTGRGAALALVAEHLERGRAVVWRGGDEAALRDSLVGAGFDPRGWGWPLHAPLFAAAAAAAVPTQGGNLPADAARRIAREGAPALPADIAALLAAAPLPPAAEAALRADLVAGHCGHIGGERLDRMLLAQRARDAAMAIALVTAWDAQRAAGRAGPVLLVAGNGHVRRDFGVPQLLAVLRPGLRVQAVGFGEHARDPAGPFDRIERTADVAREDPCRAFRLPAAPAPAAR